MDAFPSNGGSSSQALHIWREAVEHTRSLSPVSFEQWFSSVQFDGFRDDGVLELTARDEFVRDWVKAHFQPALVKRMIAAGHLGRKTGRGFFNYSGSAMFGG